MPLIVSLDGVALPYAEPLIAPVGPAFAAVLSTELNRAGLPDGALPSFRDRAKTAQRSYDAASTPARKPVLVAGDIMTSPAVSVSSDLSLKSARELMNARFRHLPVTSAGGQLVGILSDRDLLKAGAEEAGTVSGLMSSKVLTATPETSIRLIADALVRNRIGALPVVDGHHRVVGIVTTTDILKAIVKQAPLELWA